MCICTLAHLWMDGWACATAYVEIRGQPVSVPTFCLVWNKVSYFFSAYQTSWRLIFQQFSCLCLLSLYEHWVAASQAPPSVFLWGQGLQTQFLILHSLCFSTELPPWSLEWFWCSSLWLFSPFPPPHPVLFTPTSFLSTSDHMHAIVLPHSSLKTCTHISTYIHT